MHCFTSTMWSYVGILLCCTVAHTRQSPRQTLFTQMQEADALIDTKQEAISYRSIYDLTVATWHFDSKFHEA